MLADDDTNSSFSIYSMALTDGGNGKRKTGGQDKQDYVPEESKIQLNAYISLLYAWIYFVYFHYLHFFKLMLN